MYCIEIPSLSEWQKRFLVTRNSFLATRNHFMAKILGPQCSLSESRADALFGTYNGCLSGKVCVVAEELLWAGSHKDAGILKDMLTSETLSLNDKYQKRWTEQNFANVFVLTNNSWAIQASMHTLEGSLCSCIIIFRSGLSSSKDLKYSD